MKRWFLGVAALVVPAGASAQVEGAYRMLEGDTLAFREVTSSAVEIRAPQGSIVAGITHEAVISATATEPGVVTAWYTDLALSSSGPNGEVRPTTTTLLGEPYRLRISPTGDVRTERAPTVPAEVQEITDLSHQFDDFLIRVPEQQPEAGSSWADTLRSNASGIPETTQSHRAVRVFTARGDTVMHGVTAQVIEVSTTVELESTSPMQGQDGLTVTTVLEGSETGHALFDWAGGRLLARVRTGSLSGVFRINAPEPVELPQAMDYESRIDALSVAGDPR